MNRKKLRQLPLISIVIGILGLAIIAILLYILPGRYRIYQTTLYDQLEEVPANPMMGFAPRAEDMKTGTHCRLVTIDLDWSEWEPEPDQFDTEIFDYKYHVDEYKKKHIYGILRFHCNDPEDGLNRDLHKAIAALGKALEGDSFIRFVETRQSGRGYVDDFRKAFPGAYIITPTDYTKIKEKETGIYYKNIGSKKKQKKALKQVASPEFWINRPAGGGLTGEMPLESLLNEDLAEVLQEIRDSHISYISDHCPDEKLMAGNGSRMISRTLGYNIYINRLQTTVNFKKDTVKQQFTFENTGVAPCYIDWPVIMTIHNRRNKVIYEKELPFKLSSFLPGKEYQVYGEFPYSKELTRGYSMGIRIVNPNDPSEFITLSQKENKPNGKGEHILYTYEPARDREEVKIARPDNYANSMILLLMDLCTYAKAKNPDFAMVTNGGYRLFMPEYNKTAESLVGLTSSVDAMLVESVYYGYEGMNNRTTPRKITQEMEEAMDYAGEAGLPTFNIEYCTAKKLRKKTAEKSRKNGSVWFVATDREYSNIPELNRGRMNRNNIDEVSEAKNFLAFLNPEKYNTKKKYLDAVRSTNYDMIFIDSEYNGKPLSKADVDSLKEKANGGRRMVCTYMSVGEAENYRSYWKDSWNTDPPPWICEMNDMWEGNYKVMFWTKPWRDILFGSEDSCLDKILSAGFDGVYLDVIDAYEYFEEQQK